MSKWDGKISNLKISPLAFPELYQELSTMHYKERSDRLRCLAMIGMYALSGGGAMAVPSQDNKAGEVESSGNDNKMNKTRSSLKDKLLQTV